MTGVGPHPEAGGDEIGTLVATVRRQLHALSLTELKARIQQGSGRGGVWEAVVELEARARAGELLREMAERGERDKGEGGDRKSEWRSATVTLSRLGITKSESSRWQRVARVPVELRDAYYRHAMQQKEPIRLTALLRWAEVRLGRENRRRRAGEEVLAAWREMERYLRRLLQTLPLAASELTASPELHLRAQRCRGLLQLVEAVLGHVPLSDLLDEGVFSPELVRLPFPALIWNHSSEARPAVEVVVVAVGQRTVVAHPLGDPDDRRVLPMGEVLVDPARLQAAEASPVEGEALCVPRCTVCGRGLADGVELPAYGPPCLECRMWAQRRSRQCAG